MSCGATMATPHMGIGWSLGGHLESWITEALAPCLEALFYCLVSSHFCCKWPLLLRRPGKKGLEPCALGMALECMSAVPGQGAGCIFQPATDLLIPGLVTCLFRGGSLHDVRVSCETSLPFSPPQAEIMMMFLSAL